MPSPEAELLDLYTSCGESLMRRGDLVQAQDLLTAAVYLAAAQGDPRTISRCQQLLLKISPKHPAALPDFDRNTKLQSQAGRIQQKYTIKKMQLLRQTLDDLEAAERSQRSVMRPPARPTTDVMPRPAAPPPPPVERAPPAPAPTAQTFQPPDRPSAPPPPAPRETPRSLTSSPVPPPRQPPPPVPVMPPIAQSPSPPSYPNINLAHEGTTVRIPLAGIRRKPPALRPYYLAILSAEGQWIPLCQVALQGVEIGREQNQQLFADIISMAPRHVSIRPNEDGKLMVDDLGSVNGVFQKITQREPLEEGAWFRIGSQLLEFHFLPPNPIEEPSGVDEVLWAPAPVTSWAEVHVLRADRMPSARYPLIQPETVLGREASRGAQIAFVGDKNASGVHAIIRRTEKGAELEDRGSMNGTFLRREGSFTVGPEDILLLGEVMVKVYVPQNPGL